MSPLPRTVWWCLSTLALGACAAEPSAHEGQGGLRVLVQLAQSSADEAAIAAQAGAASGRVVRYVAATSERWHALAIRCADELDCEAALGRLRADTTHFASVQRDGRKRVVSP